MLCSYVLATYIRTYIGIHVVLNLYSKIEIFLTQKDYCHQCYENSPTSASLPQFYQNIEGLKF